jgi:hypothetical protein
MTSRTMSDSFESVDDSTQHTPETGVAVVDKEVQRKRTRKEIEDEESGSPSPVHSPTEPLGKLKPQRLTYDAPVETEDEEESAAPVMPQPGNPSIPSLADGDLEEGEILPVCVLGIAG